MGKDCQLIQDFASKYRTQTENFGPLAHKYVSIIDFNTGWERAMSDRRLQTASLENKEPM